MLGGVHSERGNRIGVKVAVRGGFAALCQGEVHVQSCKSPFNGGVGFGGAVLGGSYSETCQSHCNGGVKVAVCGGFAALC